MRQMQAILLSAAVALVLLPSLAWAQDASGTSPGGTSGAITNPAARTKVSTSALASNLVVASAPANLYHFEVMGDSTLYASEWWIMVFDAVSDPGGGAVTPALCYDMPALTRGYEQTFANPPGFSTGIVISVSTTGCYTETNSTHMAFGEGEK